MGFPRGGVIWVDTRFRSAYLLATHRFGRSAVSARAEAFGTSNRGSLVTDTDSENGWALTAAVRRDLGPNLSLLGELLHIDSKRQSRALVALPARQSTTQAQVALRLRF